LSEEGATPGEVPDLGIHRPLVPDGARCEEHASDPALFRCAVCATYRCEACLWGKRGAREICRACAKDGLPQPIAWERRGEIGVVRGYLETVREVLVSPVRFFRTPALEDDAVGGFEHGLVSFGVGQIAVVLQAATTLLVFGGAFAIGTHAPPVIAVFGGYGCFLLALVPTMMVHVPVTTLVSVGIAAVAMHGTLMLLGAARAPFYAGTVRATSYAFATHALFVVPVAGPLIAVFWTVLIEAIGIREVHRCGSGIALIAALGFRLLFVGSVIAIYAMLGAAVLASMQH
jgi:hypothetical protein